jgi:proton-coupled amino acid transporter
MAVGMGVADEETPLLMLPGHGHGGASVLRTAGNIFISIVGAGVLGLPYTFRVAGWAVAASCVVGAASLTYYCMLLLVGCKDSIAKGNGLRVHTYGDLGQMAFGVLGRNTVDILILISQVGCCVSYLIFLGQNVSSVVTNSTADSPYFIFILIVFQMFLASVRSLSSLAPFSIFADICNVAAMVLIIKDDLKDPGAFKNLNPATTLTAVPFAMGVGIYCFEGFGMTLTLEASMKQPQKFARILALDFAAITALYVTFGFIGYWAFGDETQDIITLNLPHDVSTVLVKIGLCIGLFFTYPVMMYPVHEIFELKLLKSAWFQRKVSPDTLLFSLLPNVVRGLSVLGTAILAVSVPGFGIFISLVGGTVCALLAFVLPAMFHMQLCGATASKFSLVVDVVLVLCGVVFAAYITSTTVASVFLTPS